MSEDSARQRGRTTRLGGVSLLVLAAALVLVPVAQGNGPAGAYDRAFLTEMVEHHAMAVDMGEMAGEKATHPQLKRAGEEIVSTQSAEIRRMQRWLREWYGERVPAMMDDEDMEDMEELDEANGAEFEIRFMALMSVHHADAIERAQTALRRGRHPQVRRLARAIVRAQEREIDQFRNWLVAWYAS